MPEAIPYNEGKYRPPSIPVNNGYLPYNTYLEKGKVYWFCSCGASMKNPFCDGLCNRLMTRNRPIYFNVTESGYYKLCNCKLSANAPFCNGTHRQVMKYTLSTLKGQMDWIGMSLYWSSYLFMFWNFYT